jgi:REP element-mobilizing transposase RayT
MGLEIHRRHLPHFTLGGSYYFVTFKLIAPPLTSQEAILIRDHIRECPNAHILAAIVMPDHVHLILTLHEGKALSATIGRLQGFLGASTQSSAEEERCRVAA